MKESLPLFSVCTGIELVVSGKNMSNEQTSFKDDKIIHMTKQNLQILLMVYLVVLGDY